MIHCNSGGRFIEGSHFKHCKLYVFSAYINQKFLCEWLCIMTDQISGFLHQKYDWKFILQFLLLTCNLYSCMLTCLTVYKLLSLFLVCSLRIYINEMLLGCVDMQLQVNPQILSAAGHIGTVDVLFFTQLGVHRFSMYPSFEFGVSLLRSVHPRFSVSEKICPPK